MHILKYSTKCFMQSLIYHYTTWCSLREKSPTLNNIHSTLKIKHLLFSSGKILKMKISFPYLFAKSTWRRPSASSMRPPVSTCSLGRWLVQVNQEGKSLGPMCWRVKVTFPVGSVIIKYYCNSHKFKLNLFICKVLYA